jgi:hypothetical protein
LRAALNVSIDGAYGVKVPYIAPTSTNIAFIAQGDPFPVLQYAMSDGPTLTAKKLGFITTLTREVVEHTDGERMVRDIMGRDFGLGLDSILFDSTAADTTRPAGLLTGLSTSGAKSGGGVTAMVDDLAKLASTVAPVGGLDLMFVAGPYAAAAITTYQPLLKFPVFCSGAVNDTTVICIAPSAVVVAGGNDPPKIDVSIETVLHMDTAPTPLSTAGTPNVIAYPVRSLFQTDVVAVRLRANIDWALRASGAVAFVSSVTW